MTRPSLLLLLLLLSVGTGSGQGDGTPAPHEGGGLRGTERSDRRGLSSSELHDIFDPNAQEEEPEGLESDAVPEPQDNGGADQALSHDESTPEEVAIMEQVPATATEPVQETPAAAATDDPAAGTTYVVEFDVADNDPLGHAMALLGREPDYVYESDAFKGFVVTGLSTEQVNQLELTAGVRRVVPDQVVHEDPVWTTVDEDPEGDDDDDATSTRKLSSKKTEESLVDWGVSLLSGGQAPPDYKGGNIAWYAHTRLLDVNCVGLVSIWLTNSGCRFPSCRRCLLWKQGD